MKIGKGQEKASPLTPLRVKWKVDDGSIQRHTKEEMTIRALHMALASLIPKRGETGDGFQYAVMGPHLYIESCTETGQPGGATYSSKGRALICRTHMQSGAVSHDVHAFSLVFREAKDQHKLPDIEIVSGDIDPLPRGTELV